MGGRTLPVPGIPEGGGALVAEGGEVSSEGTGRETLFFSGVAPLSSFSSSLSLSSSMSPTSLMSVLASLRSDVAVEWALWISNFLASNWAWITLAFFSISEYPYTTHVHT